MNTASRDIVRETNHKRTHKTLLKRKEKERKENKRNNWKGGYEFWFLTPHVSLQFTLSVGSPGVPSERLTSMDSILDLSPQVPLGLYEWGAPSVTRGKEGSKVRGFVRPVRSPCAVRLPKSKVTHCLKVTFCTWFSFLQILTIVSFSHLFWPRFNNISVAVSSHYQCNP